MRKAFSEKYNEKYNDQISCIAGGNEKWYRYLEDRLAVSYKTKHVI